MFNDYDHLSLTGDTEDINYLQNDNNLSEYALLFPNVDSILIPKKTEYNLRKYVSKPMLKTIDSNVNVAVEKCLVFLSNLASTYYTDDKWKRLHSRILHMQTMNKKDNTYIYTRIIDVLTRGTATGAFIEVNDSYEKGGYSKSFRLTDNYLNAGLIGYIIKDAGIIHNRNRLHYHQLTEAVANPICSNLIKMYRNIDLPTSEELLVIGKQLVKKGHRTKKGKILTIRNKHKNNDYWKDSENRSFVEDNIKLFEFLTGRGFMIPCAGGENNGGRVVDSFTLMPAWIRDQITIDSQKLTECDYTALHPNIAIKLYDGNESYLTHQSVAERADIDLKTIKVEHLSFFNKEWNHMRNSPLFKYYSKNEADMLANIYRDKKEHGHKITSRKMFKIEVDIMTDVIKYLNSKGVYVLYVYDALLCEDKDRTLVIETMNRVILEHGIKTRVKVDTVLSELEPSPSAESVGVESIAVELPKYALDTEVSLYDILPLLSFTVEDTMKVITDIDHSQIPMGDLVRYIGKQIKEQKYNDYTGVQITDVVVSKLKAMITR